MRRLCRALALSVAASATVLLAACSGADTPDSTPSDFTVEPAEAESASASASTSPSASPSETREENNRGELMKDIGEVAGSSSLQSPDSEKWLQFKVTSITEAVCTASYAEKPANGNHLLQVNLEVETTPEMRDTFEEDGTWPVSLNFNQDWHAYASNGTTMNNVDTVAALSCLDQSDTIPSEIGPAEKAQGSVVLEVSDTQGEIAHRPWWLGGGWTWEYDITDAS